jgi:hypothetical protein
LIFAQLGHPDREFEGIAARAESAGFEIRHDGDLGEATPISSPAGNECNRDESLGSPSSVHSATLSRLGKCIRGAALLSTGQTF